MNWNSNILSDRSLSRILKGRLDINNISKSWTFVMRCSIVCFGHLWRRIRIFIWQLNRLLLIIERRSCRCYHAVQLSIAFALIVVSGGME
jgi:hypothetical protein